MDDRESYIEHKKAALAALKEKLKEAQDAREAAQSQAAVLREQVESLKQHMVNTVSIFYFFNLSFRILLKKLKMLDKRPKIK